MKGGIGGMVQNVLAGQPIIILREGTRRDRGKGAHSNNIAAAKAIADAVRSTLGPRGMDKMLVNSMGDVVVTNDVVTILKEIDVEHPVAKMIVEVAKTQDDECGDGTTTAVILAGELLKRSESLIEQNVHPTVVVNGFKMASARASELLKEISFSVKPHEESVLRNIAATAMTGKSLGEAKNYLADLAVKAVRAIVEKRDGQLVADVDNIKVQKKHGGSITDTSLVEGVIIDKERVHPQMPRIVKKARIALVNKALEIKKTEVEAKIRIRDPSQIQKFMDEEDRTLKGYVDNVKRSGANVVICQKGIDDLVQHYLAKEGIYAVRRAKEEDMELLVKATGGKVVTNLEDLSPGDLGRAEEVEERKIGDTEMTFVAGCKEAKAMSILIRGGTEHIVNEVERVLHDGLRVVAVAIEDGKAVAGGGAPEIELALKLRKYAQSVGGREQLAVEAFAQALEIIPWTLSENAGLDAVNILVELKKMHEGDGKSVGVDVFGGKVADMLKLNVLEPLRVKKQAIESATEAAAMILRIDDVIAAKKFEEKGVPGAPRGPPPGMPGGMPPGMM